MIEILLMYSLLKAMPYNMKRILIGDVDQLTSVSPGQIFADIIASVVIHVIKLEKIFRQAQKSHIITNAHKINNGEIPYLTDHHSDFLFLEKDDQKMPPSSSSFYATNSCKTLHPKMCSSSLL